MGIAFLYFWFSSFAFAGGNDVFSDLFFPKQFGGTRVKLEERIYSEAKASGETFKVAQSKFDASIPIVRENQTSWRFISFLDYEAWKSRSSFSQSRPSPTELWDPGLGISHSREFDNGRSASGAFTLSSPSDRPFGSFRDYGFNLNLSYRLPQPSGNAWILLASASNTRGFLPYLPLPGAGYFFSSSNWKGLLGFPFGLIFWTPSPIWTVSAFFFPIRYGELKITYGQPRSLQAFSQISFRGRSYWLSDRSNDKERLFAEEGVAQAGLSAPVYRGVILEFSGGWAFARSYFLAEKISEKNSMLKISPDNGAFANLKLGIFLR